MKHKILFAALVAVVAILALNAWPRVAANTPAQDIDNIKTGTTTPEVVESATTTPTPEPLPVTPTGHRQEVWLYALEWCESRAVHSAINKVDVDGTPSYYAFQFKPGTFRGYGEQYGVIQRGLPEAELMELLKSYELQREIVKHMIDDPTVNWYLQFPACVRQLGLPPR